MEAKELQPGISVPASTETENYIDWTVSKCHAIWEQSKGRKYDKAFHPSRYHVVVELILYQDEFQEHVRLVEIADNLLNL